MDYASQSDEAVEQRFREARRYEQQVCFWVQDHHVKAKLQEFKIRARGAEAEASKRGERPDEPDIWLPDLRVAIEVKGRDVYFKYYKDFPHKSVYTCSKNSLAKMRASGIPRAALVIVSTQTKHLLAVPWRPDLWWAEWTNHGGFPYEVMVARRDQLRPMSWLLRLLRQGPPYPWSDEASRAPNGENR